MRYKLTIRFFAIFLFGLCGFLPRAAAAPGELDSTFSSDGIVRETVGVSSRDEILGVAIQADGKIVVAGFVVYGQSVGCGIARYNPDGSFDTSFDGDGRVIVQINGTFECQDVAIQADGKIVAAGFNRNNFNYDFAVVRLNPDGALDTSFDGDGKVTTDVSNNADAAYAVAVQTDGKIVLAGRTTGATDDFAVVRYNPNGSLDLTFDGDGKAITDFSGGSDHARAIAVQADGKILVAGNSSAGSSTNDFALVRYNSTGALDPSFDGDGKATTDVSGSHDNVNAIAVQADGKIVAAGQSITAGLWKISLVRYKADGALDSSFDTDGKLMTSISNSHDFVYAIAVQTDGKIVAAGSSTGANGGFAVVRYHESGALDASFDGDGIVTSLVLGGGGAYAAAIQADGRILAAGTAGNGTSSTDFAVVRYNSTGALDNTFDGDGIKTNPMGSWTSSAAAVAVQPDGRIVVVGSGYNGTNYDFAVTRYHPTGELDASFDGDGKALTDFLNYQDFAYTVAVQPDGKIVVAGVASGGSALARYNPDGSLDPTFDKDGKVTIDIASLEGISAIAFQADGKIVAAGYSQTELRSDITVFRFDSSGTLDAKFDNDGIVTTDFFASDDYASAVAVQADGKIVVAGRSSADAQSGDFALVRYNADGSLDASFDADGKLLTDFTGTIDAATGIALQPDGRIVAAGITNNGSNSDFALARYHSNGSLDASFDTDGKAVTDVSSSEDYAGAIVIQTDGKIIVAGRGRNFFADDFALVRYQPNGSLDNTYGNGGKAFFDLHGDDWAFGIALDSIGRAVVAGDAGGLFTVARVLGDAAPPAVTVSISGRVLRANGSGVFNGFITITDAAGNARIARTNPFGYYRFINVPGGTITIGVSAKRFTFANPVRTLTLTNNVGDLDFTAIE